MDEADEVDAIPELLGAAARTTTWLCEQIDQGGFGRDPADVADHCRLPLHFLAAGELRRAHRALDRIAADFLRADGDVRTTPEARSGDPFLEEHAAIAAAWVALAARKLGRFDVAGPTERYLERFFNPEVGGFASRRPYDRGEREIGVLTTSALGLLSIYAGDLRRASTVARALVGILDRQPGGRLFLLRARSGGALVADFPADAAAYYAVDTQASAPAQFFVFGHAIAFLCQLHRASGEPQHLDAAGRYLEIAMYCDSGFRTSPTSHAFAWGAAIYARLAGKERIAKLARSVGLGIAAAQREDGSFAGSPGLTAECGIWLRELAAEL